MNTTAEFHNSNVTASGPIQAARFSPYDWNGGSVVAVAGEDFVVLAADTRLATGYNIKSRNISRIHRISQNCFVGCGGCFADTIALYHTLSARATIYRHQHGTEMKTVAAAQLLSNTLYQRRFFPIYALAVVAGLDDEGKGYCAGYDAVGSYIRSREGYQANGGAASIIMPILDNVFGSGNAGYSSGPKPPRPYTVEETIEIIKSAFIAAGEREIMLGDSVEIHVMRKGQEQTQKIIFELKKD